MYKRNNHSKNPWANSYMFSKQQFYWSWSEFILERKGGKKNLNNYKYKYQEIRTKWEKGSPNEKHKENHQLVVALLKVCSWRRVKGEGLAQWQQRWVCVCMHGGGDLSNT